MTQEGFFSEYNDIKYINVILPLKLEWEPSYSVPSELPINIGDRVKVKFSGKEYLAVVSNVDITPDFDLKRILPIIEKDDNLDPILEGEIILWRNIATYYLCTVGEVYKAAYPSLKTSKEEAAAQSKRKAAERLEKKEAKRAEKLTSTLSKLKARLEAKTAQKEKARSDSTASKYQAEIDAISKIIKETEQALSTPLEDTHNNKETAPSPVDSQQVEIPILSDCQHVAYEEILKSFREGKTALLNGITGSGKTEIYITLAQNTLAEGRNVLYLVPEIALSRQLEDRLRKAFTDKLLIFHSQETAASKRDAVSFIRKNGPYVLLGTRSALLLPHHDLGLVIVDEEHDSSYKQEDPAPRYNGRETAIMLAKINGANVILGSATPSLESIYNCQAGRYSLVNLSKRYYDGDDSDVEIIDTIAERRKRGMVGNFSRKLIVHINQCLKNKGQVLILRARRAYSPVLQCEQCGEIVKCPHCNVTMSLHVNSSSFNQAQNTLSPIQGKLLCHYCGHTEPYTGTCQKCGGTLKQIGAGTQRIEEEAKELFPEARIARLDSDSAKAAGYEKKTIEDFEKGNIDILIGTQIISKGFDFQGLSLVVVLQADGILAQQDFRADERAAQLLSQFRGRCGRRGKKGLFVIQTAQSEHPVYTAIEEDCIGRSLRLLSERKMFGYPPYSRIVNIVLKDNNQPRVNKLSNELAKKISATIPAEITGPFPPSNDKLFEQWILHIRVSLKKDRNLVSSKNTLTKIIKDFEREFSYTGHIHIDVDPS